MTFSEPVPEAASRTGFFLRSVFGSGLRLAAVPRAGYYNCVTVPKSFSETHA
jgi:hypothetical protein